jgi:hypothetical protein
MQNLQLLNTSQVMGSSVSMIPLAAYLVQSQCDAKVLIHTHVSLFSRLRVKKPLAHLSMTIAAFTSISLLLSAKLRGEKS